MLSVYRNKALLAVSLCSESPPASLVRRLFLAGPADSLSNGSEVVQIEVPVYLASGNEGPFLLFFGV